MVYGDNTRPERKFGGTKGDSPHRTIFIIVRFLFFIDKENFIVTANITTIQAKPEETSPFYAEIIGHILGEETRHDFLDFLEHFHKWRSEEKSYFIIIT